MNDKELKDKQLESVAGGKGPDPSTYIYECELLSSGVCCKQEPRDDSETICTISKYTIIYVTELNCGNDYVKCMFKGDHHREYGYIKERYVPRLSQ